MRMVWAALAILLAVLGSACSDEPVGGAPAEGDVEIRLTGDETVWVRLVSVESFGGFEHNSHLISLGPEIQVSIGHSVTEGVYRAECHGGEARPALGEVPDTVLPVRVEEGSEHRLAARGTPDGSCELLRRSG